ncbi:MAG: hypothetical protein WA667_02110 [Candidatus Nitrosopolaris sp.]
MHTKADPCSNIDFYWKHVYDSNRLAIQTVLGRVEDDPHTEADGDSKFVIQLSSKDAHYSNPNNRKNHNPKCDLLLVEIVCHDSIINIHTRSKSPASNENGAIHLITTAAKPCQLSMR